MRATTISDAASDNDNDDGESDVHCNSISKVERGMGSPRSGKMVMVTGGMWLWLVLWLCRYWEGKEVFSAMGKAECRNRGQLVCLVKVFLLFLAVVLCCG